MDPANLPSVGMQGPHRYTLAGQQVTVHSVVVASKVQILLTCLYHAFFLLHSGYGHESTKHLHLINAFSNVMMLPVSRRMQWVCSNPHGPFRSTYWGGGGGGYQIVLLLPMNLLLFVDLTPLPPPPPRLFLHKIQLGGQESCSHIAFGTLTI